MDGLATQHQVTLSGAELMLLRAGLKAYLSAFEVHRAEDRGKTHPQEQMDALYRQVGELIWRLEEAGAPPGAHLIHSAEAVEPPSAQATE